MIEEEKSGWDEHWIICGGVSKPAQEAIESVGGHVYRLNVLHLMMPPMLYGVCLLHDDDDDYQGFEYSNDDDKEARKLYICSPDERHDLCIYCPDASIPRFESSPLDLRIVTLGEWFEIADERNSQTK